MGDDGEKQTAIIEDRLTNICNILMPLKEITMSLQSEKADAQLGVKVIHFLKEMARREPALNSPIRTVLSKWVNGNDMVRVKMI